MGRKHLTVICAIFLNVILLLSTSRSFAEESDMLAISSSEFINNEPIPTLYTCLGEDINPPLTISGIPPQTQSLVLIVDDPDAPMGIWVHWVVFNIPPAQFGIPAGTSPGMQGANDFGRNAYGGPCPPNGTHRYFFKLYALDSVLDLNEGATKDEVEKAMEGHIIGQAQLIGLYNKRYQ